MFVGMVVVTIPGLTVIIIASAFVEPALSVTVNQNEYVPCVRPVTVVVAEDGDVIVTVPPEIFVHAYEAIVPSESVPEPVRVTDEVGRVIV